MNDLLTRVRRVSRKPPRYIADRLLLEARAEAERYWGPRRARGFNVSSLLAATGSTSLAELWEQLRSRPYLARVHAARELDYNRLCPGDYQRILHTAEEALNHRVDLLGSGSVELGSNIDWHRDYKTQLTWPLEHCRGLDYVNRDRPSDVKFPWELSRMQWLIPVGQAFLLTGNEHYASAAREIFTDWIQANPYSYGVNWACTMEVALRILSWTWFFHAFAGSNAWSDSEFRQKFLRTLFLHAEFTERHIEKSDINGNHYTADAAGLVFAGLFFRTGAAPARWLKAGWQILTEELTKQVFEDGVDFEASVPYHRLVLELFFLPALYREAAGLEIAKEYKDRLAKMGEFVAAYSRPDGSIPLWGDNDDARALPFGGQDVNDHRYLLALLGCTWATRLAKYFSGPRSEVFWLLGERATDSLAQTSVPPVQPGSSSFPNGGFYIMRSDRDHVFIDCGPVGLAGRGGHGHNDLLSFEAVLDGVPLVCDCGSYVYTADFAARNHFRSTACHNTPMINGEEINRFTPTDLWTLHNDAKPILHWWSVGKERTAISMAHTGFMRLKNPVRVAREISLNHLDHTLNITDEFEGETEVPIHIPMHLHPSVEIVNIVEPGIVELRRGSDWFEIKWNSPAEWELSINTARISPTYGVIVPAQRLLWRRVDARTKRIAVRIGRAGKEKQPQ